MSHQPTPLDQVPANWQEKHVIQVYNLACQTFDGTRSHVWECVHQVLNELPPNSRIIELGCGNGRHLTRALELNRGHQVQGQDISPAMVQLCYEEKGLAVVEGNICQFQENWQGKFDLVLSMAVIHHLESPESRKLAIKNCLLYTRPGGEIMLSVWATKQGPKSKRTFIPNETCDYFVPFKNKHGEILGQRYYHLFKENELKDLVISSIHELGLDSDTENQASILAYWWEESNWIIRIKLSEKI